MAKWEKGLVAALKETKKAASIASQISTAGKDKVLREVAKQLRIETSFLIRENRKDLAKAVQNGLSTAMIDRLTLTPDRIKGMAEGVLQVSKLKDPVGNILSRWKRPNGLQLSKVSVPIGVILIIFESRPNVTVECGALCLKSGNAVLLRGGKEAYCSNKALVRIFEKALKKYKLPSAWVNFVETTDHAAVDFLLHRDQDIHLVIPRGGEALIRKVAAVSRIPVIKHYKGICHVYVDKAADLKKALRIAVNAKLQRPGVCNAMETLLVHQKVAGRFLPQLGEELRRQDCEVRGDKQTLKHLTWAKKAESCDYGYEYLDKILAIKVVPDLRAAVEHIRVYGSGHTDAIVTRNKKTAEAFAQQVDSSSVMINASTRFSDGFEYGFGAEIGISTDKIHARGPMGLEGLTTYKYIVEGNGQIRT